MMFIVLYKLFEESHVGVDGSWGCLVLPFIFRIHYFIMDSDKFGFMQSGLHYLLINYANIWHLMPAKVETSLVLYRSFGSLL